MLQWQSFYCSLCPRACVSTLIFVFSGRRQRAHPRRWSRWRVGARLWRVRRVAAVLWRRLTGFSELHGLIPSSALHEASLHSHFLPSFCLFSATPLFSPLSLSFPGPSHQYVGQSSLSCIPPVLKAADGCFLPEARAKYF